MNKIKDFVEGKTVPCKYCGTQTRMTGPQTCYNCYEVACRVRQLSYTVLRNILKDTGRLTVNGNLI